MRVFSKGTGRRRAPDKVRELYGRLDSLRAELDTVTARLASVRADRDFLAERVLTAEADARRASDERAAALRQATAANEQTALLEGVIAELRELLNKQRAEEAQAAIPVIEDATPTIELAVPGALPRIPSWARENGFVFSRSTGFRRIPPPLVKVAEGDDAEGS